MKKTPFLIFLLFAGCAGFAQTTAQDKDVHPPSAWLRRNERATVGMAGAGVWIPGGHLSALGSHPSMTFPVMGIRNKLNELDLVFSFRFFSTPHNYTVLRNGILYQRNYFLGGYIGVDYTRYLLHSARFESGPVAGIGYDGFGIDATSRYNNKYSYLAPHSIGSLNGNLGFRCNYFFNPGFYIGAACKYHFINYANAGGTPLDGHAQTIDLYVGLSWPK